MDCTGCPYAVTVADRDGATDDHTLDTECSLSECERDDDWHH